MRILHVINRCGVANGAARLILDLAKIHIHKGHKVDILTLVAIHPSYKDEFIKIGCSYTSILSQGCSMKNPMLLLKVKKIMQEYDIVHAHLFPAFYWVALAKFIFKLKCKLVFTEHAPENNRRKIWLRPIERFIYRQYDIIIAISDAVKKNIEDHLRSDYDVITVENGVNLAPYKNVEPNLRQELGLSCEDKVIMQVAGFRPEKDQMTVLKAITLLPNNYHAVFVGDGKLLDMHTDTAKKLGVLDRCHFLGTRNDIPELLVSADIIVVSSHFEGFGLAAVEGMAAKKPVIVSNVPGLSDVIGNAGWLFESHNAKDLAQKILLLCQNNQLYNEIAQRCSMRALSYDIVSTAEKYEKGYERLLYPKSL